MPTKIVLDKTPRSKRAAPARSSCCSSNHFYAPGLTTEYTRRIQRRHKEGDEENVRAESSDFSAPSRGDSQRGNSRSARKRSIMSFRSSLLRELSVRMEDESCTEEEPEPEVMVRLSSDDIRASPRLMGYLFAMTAGAVMLVSVFQFYREDITRVRPSTVNATEELLGKDTIDNDMYYVTSTGGLVFRWKVWASIYSSAGAVALCLFTFLVHFDTVFFPKLWVTVFRDGSLAERNWIFLLMAGWAALLHFATSVLSVGEYQANVYFTTWIGFAAIALTYSVWRESAGLTSLNEKAISKHCCETTYNWLWTCLFSVIFAASATDLFLNRDVVELRFRGEALILKEADWTIVLAVTWAEAALCGVVVVFNEFLFVNAWHCPCRLWGGRVVYRVVFGWRQFEGLLILASMGAKFFAILEYTGVDGVINGLSNAYFGIWGSFFSSVFAFGTWLHENKDLEWLVRDCPSEAGENSEE